MALALAGLRIFESQSQNITTDNRLSELEVGLTRTYWSKEQQPPSRASPKSRSCSESQQISQGVVGGDGVVRITSVRRHQKSDSGNHGRAG
jgi:hypothetical protein